MTLLITVALALHFHIIALCFPSSGAVAAGQKNAVAIRRDASLTSKLGKLSIGKALPSEILMPGIALYSQPQLH